MNLNELKEKSKQIRTDILNMLYKCQSGHPGGSLSCVEMLMAIYYKTAKVDPKNPKMEDRDRLVLSKGHGCPALYSILADLQFFPKSDLDSLRQLDSHLQGHPDMKKTPGVDASTGSLGQGIAIALGMALAAKHKKQDHKVFAVMGDGELQEGIVWEAAQSAAHYKLDNLIVLVDNNGLQIDGAVKDVLAVGDVVKKFDAFGFDCYEVDGHDIEEIAKAIQLPSKGKPRLISCKTIKGKGVSFMEDNYSWHGKILAKEEYEKAMEVLV